MNDFPGRNSGPPLPPMSQPAALVVAHPMAEPHVVCLMAAHLAAGYRAAGDDRTVATIVDEVMELFGHTVVAHKAGVWRKAHQQAFKDRGLEDTRDDSKD